MTADQFRAIALSFPDAVESFHMNHPDFRVGGKIFATLGYPNGKWGALSLPTDEQACLIDAEPEGFIPAKGAWGRAGATQVCLARVRLSSVRSALKIAWQYRVEKNAAGKSKKHSRKQNTPDRGL